jgi:hypothetical protein
MTKLLNNFILKIFAAIVAPTILFFGCSKPETEQQASPAVSPPPWQLSDTPALRPRLVQNGYTYVRVRPETPIDNSRSWTEFWAREPVRSGDPVYVLHRGIFIRSEFYTIP